MDISTKLEACIKTRKLNAQAFERALRDALDSSDLVSEVWLRDRWLKYLREDSSIFDDGWYMPPPHGMGVLFSTHQDISRTNFQSLRSKEFWPRDNVFLDKEQGVAMIYASPVDRTTYAIGDFELTLYFGSKPAIKDHLAKTLQLDIDLADAVKIGMSFAELASLAEKLMNQRNLINNVLSINDPIGVNIGHTLPGTLEDWTEAEGKTLQDKDWNVVKDTIAAKRLFVNQSEQQQIKPGMAFTIEPRPLAADQSDVPMASFHTTVVIQPDGSTQHLMNFDSIFELAGMDYMPKG